MTRKYLCYIFMIFLATGVVFGQEICEIPSQPPPVAQRLDNRDFPSIFQSWDDLVVPENLIPTNPTDRLILHDLHFSPSFGLRWYQTSKSPYYGLSTRLSGDLNSAKNKRQERLHHNPNMVMIREVRLHNHFDLEAFPPDSEFWLGTKSGTLWDEHLIDILNPEVQQLHIARIVGIAECGLYDGVILDGFYRNATGFVGSHHYPEDSDPAIIEATEKILKGVRERVRDDFLILANANDTKMTHYTEYVNGAFMEIGAHNPDFYSYERLKHLEAVLLWNERHLRSPQINSLRARGFGQFAPDAPENRKWMRLFTTMSLTHSNGYVLYVTGRSHFFNGVDAEGNYIPHHEHIWYRFWDADLGRPIGAKGQTYNGIEGLFIREFTNGYAVYNRSGTAQTIRLPVETTGVSSQLSAAGHQLGDLDGEIYIKTPNGDLNADGVVNILDLVIVANAFGEASPDLNGDGIVNVLDLVIVANAFHGE